MQIIPNYSAQLCKKSVVIGFKAVKELSGCATNSGITNETSNILQLTV